MNKKIKWPLTVLLYCALIAIGGCRKCYECDRVIKAYWCYHTGMNDSILIYSDVGSYPSNDSTYTCEHLFDYNFKIEGCDKSFIQASNNLQCVEK